MLPQLQRDHAGFTLIELMIVVVVVAILASIAVPAYQDQIRKARRSDGLQALLKISLEQEKFRANCPEYAHQLAGTRECDTSGGSYILGVSTSSSESYYTLSITQGTPTEFTARAQALGDQQKDDADGTSCSALTLDESGNKTPTACWQ